jgi:hypothetical protein
MCENSFIFIYICIYEFSCILVIGYALFQEDGWIEIAHYTLYIYICISLYISFEVYMFIYRRMCKYSFISINIFMNFLLFQLSDMRYSKRMDGSKSFTICGDALYFAPEIIKQQGDKKNNLHIYIYVYIHIYIYIYIHK